MFHSEHFHKSKSLRTCSLLAMGLRDIDFLPVPSLFLFYHALCPSKGTAELKIILSKDYRLRELGIYIYSKNTGS